MSRALRQVTHYTVLVTATLLPPLAHADRAPLQRPSVQLGPRPYYLVDDLPRGELKTRLERCSEGPFSKSDFSIGHRGTALQFFNLSDVEYWLEREPRFGKQAVFLDDRVDRPGGYEAAVLGMPELAAAGVRIVAPPTWALVELDASGEMVPSAYARAAKDTGLDIITWTLERSGPLKGGGGYYFQSVSDVIDRDSDALVLLDVLARDVGVRGVFSDWPATVTYYANCMGL